MTEQKKEEVKAEPKLYSEPRGKYSILDESKSYNFDYPLSNSLEDNLKAITFLKDKVFEALILQKKQQEDNAKKEKAQKDASDEQSAEESKKNETEEKK